MVQEDRKHDSGEVLGQVIDLRTLITVQESSIVSRTLLKRPGGTITLFAFDAQQALSEHSTPLDAMVQVLSGRVRITVDGQPHELTAGQAIVMPANTAHAVHAVEPLKMLLMMVHG